MGRKVVVAGVVFCVVRGGGAGTTRGRGVGDSLFSLHSTKSETFLCLSTHCASFVKLVPPTLDSVFVRGALSVSFVFTAAVVNLDGELRVPIIFTSTGSSSNRSNTV